MKFTPAQQEAIAARGNVLVVAGAGTGKTRTLVERCLACLLQETPPISLDQILMVTFTDAAAAEMRQRIRERIAQHIAEHPRDLRWPEQLAMFDTAHIGTLHGFCLQLVRQHFYELELDPQLAVMPEEEARLLAEETLDGILQQHYAGDSEFAEAVQLLIQAQGRGWDEPIRDLVFRLHDYTQTLRDPAGWFTAQLAMFELPEPARWEEWLLIGAREWRERWLPELESLAEGNSKAAEGAAMLRTLPANLSRAEWANVFEQVRIADQTWPNRKKTVLRDPFKDFFEEAEFLGSLTRVGDRGNPLAEDWNWTRKPMSTLLRLAQEFTDKFSGAKRELGVVDFHDLEQHALRLLCDRATGQPTEVAIQWRERLRFVFVDEYQDINEAQDAILTALSREGSAANRFLVGDAKQSIYRFRLADPRIFQRYVENWRGQTGNSIPLTDNFRSREAILNFVNSLFGGLMRREIGGVAYDHEARLRFGAPDERGALRAGTDASPRIELHLRLKGSENSAADGDDESGNALAELRSLEDAGKEARLVALRLRELKTSGHLIWDEESKAMRPVKWSDMAVLLRSPTGKAECFAREFTRLGVPLRVARGGFYDSMEVADLVSLLQLLDNPLQDVPALAALHSPLVGMTADELAAVRLALPQARFWAALQRFHETAKKHPAWPKAERFFKNFAAWRRLARQVSLSRCLETVLTDTHYAEWLLTQPRGEQRHANVRRLIALARQFDQFQRQGLFRFLRFIQAQQAAESEPDVAAITGEDTVSLMSIHQSKGLEFPVVVVADLGKSFNLSDLHAEIILDEQFGLCPRIKPPHTGRRYPSLPYWLAGQRQRREAFGEEMRLLYVATTRARDTLILSGGVSQKKFEESWPELKLSTASLLKAGNYLFWIAAWATQSAGGLPAPPSGLNELWSWTIYNDLDPRLMENAKSETLDAENAPATHGIDTASLRKLRDRLAWQYPHAAATSIAAKNSVTMLRRQLADESDAEAKPFYRFQPQSFGAKFRVRKVAAKLSATEIGNAHHAFLQWLSLDRAGTVAELRAEARRMEEESILEPDEVAALDFNALAAFWQSDLGKKVRAQAKFVRRELAFTARYSPNELPGTNAVSNAEEFVVVQGAADLAIILPDTIWLLDFKTDQIEQSELDARSKIYEPQLRYYALALERIYRRPVTERWLHFLALNRSVSCRELAPRPE